MERKHTKLLEQISKWTAKGEHLKVLETLLDIPREDYDSQLVSILASTYNSLGEYEKAIPQLLSIEDESQNNPDWFYCLGNSYYYTGQIEEAEDCFLRAVELTPNDVNTKEFIYRCHPSFAARVDTFWHWFEENESTMDNLCTRHNYDKDKCREFLMKGLSVLGCKTYIRFINNHEACLITGSNDHLFYLHSYLIRCMPENLKKKWTFHPYDPGFDISELKIDVDGQTMRVAEIQVKATYDSSTNRAKVEFYHPLFNKASNRQEAYNAFCNIVYFNLGEAFSQTYICDIIQASEAQEDMLPFVMLHDDIVRQIKSCGMRVCNSPEDLRFDYQCEYSLQEDAAFEARLDIIGGTTSYPLLIKDFYQGKTKRFSNFLSYGAKTAYLAFTYNSEKEREQMLALREELEDRINKEIFLNSDGYPGSGRVLGWATGTECMYVDLLLFDEKDFIRRIRKMAKDYPVNMYLSDFHLGAWYTLIRAYDDNEVSHKYLSRCIRRDDL